MASIRAEPQRYSRVEQVRIAAGNRSGKGEFPDDRTQMGKTSNDPRSQISGAIAEGSHSFKMIAGITQGIRMKTSQGVAGGTI